MTSASLMESATEPHTKNLIDYFADDQKSRVAKYWLPEELQHGEHCAVCASGVAN
jgi:hypothetical protein